MDKETWTASEICSICFIQQFIYCHLQTLALLEQTVFLELYGHRLGEGWGGYSRQTYACHCPCHSFQLQEEPMVECRLEVEQLGSHTSHVELDELRTDTSKIDTWRLACGSSTNLPPLFSKEETRTQCNRLMKRWVRTQLSLANPLS